MTGRRASTIRRRLVTIPRLLVLFALVTMTLPLLAVVALVVDGVRFAWRRRPAMATRLTAFLWVYLASEVVAVVALALVWLAGRRRLAERTYRLQGLWAGALFAAARGIFALRLDVQGDDEVAPGPVVVLMRHASIVDNLLPAVLVTRPHGLRLRYVLKHELLSDPAIDIAGLRLRNCFVARGSGSAAELERVRALAAGLGQNEGVLIYPEGTRFTAGKRARAIERLAQSDPSLHERAIALRNVLPPRSGGVLALLDAGTDVVICAHRGLDGFASVGDLWRGGLVRTLVSVRFTRFPAREIPASHTERMDWLWQRWSDVDRWIAAEAA